jgi:transcriptional regulator GlxA family with amidase domain
MTSFGDQLRLLNTVGSQSNKIDQAIIWLRENYHETLQVDKLAATLNMAFSTLYKYFKEVTTLSPLQYQKRLRLDEAQRLMLVENYDATQAALWTLFTTDAAHQAVHLEKFLNAHPEEEWSSAVYFSGLIAVELE